MPKKHEASREETGQQTTANKVLRHPAINVAIFAFLLNFPWEFWQVPFFRDMVSSSHWDGIKQCSLATFGDALIAVSAFAVASRLGQGRNWYLEPRWQDMAAYLFTGILATIVFEALATEVFGNWEYGDAMPILPGIGTGIVPLIQWIVIPPLVILIVRRQLS